MKIRNLIYLILIFNVACSNHQDQKADRDISPQKEDMVFDETKWKLKEDGDYPYREKMVENILYYDSIRALLKHEILDLFGEPNRINNNHLYYTVKRKRLGFWTLHKETLVIKLYGDDTVEWIKIHE